MRWTCAVCRRNSDGPFMLGVRAHLAAAGIHQTSQFVHAICFYRVGMTYGVRSQDLEDAGWQWWVRHLRDMDWVYHTDLIYVISEMSA